VKPVKCLALAAVFLMTMGGVSMASVDFPTEYSAKTVTTSPEGTSEAMQYVSGQKMRMEVAGNMMIIRPDLNVMLILMPSEKMYMEHPLDPKMMKQASLSHEGMSQELVGTEEIDGKSAEKYLMKYTSNGQEESFHVWTGQGGRPLRTQALDQSWTVDYKEFNPGAQDPSLFEAPSDYQKMAMPNMGDMMAQAMAGNE
jgi:hypothetical protein